MEQRTWMEGLNKFFVWFMNLAYLNLLWAVFSLGGAVVLGAAPSTSALFAVIRKLFDKDKKVPITKTFFLYFRRDFVEANGLFYVMFAIALFLYIDIYFLYQIEGFFSTLLLFVLLLFVILFIMTSVFIFPVFVHYDLKFFGYIKQSFFIGMMKPFHLIAMVIGLVIPYFIMSQVPSLIIFFGVSIGALIIMSISYHIFSGIELKASQ
jgi:uncharacterized membrane protein YesL